MRRLMFVTMALATLAAAGCGGPLSPLQRSELERARARWESAGITDYTVESRIRCFCPGHTAVWTRLSIRDNRVIDTQPLEPLPPGSPATTFGWSTVTDLFDRIEELDETEYIKSVTVQYRPGTGLPAEHHRDVSIERHRLRCHVTKCDRCVRTTRVAAFARGELSFVLRKNPLTTRSSDRHLVFRGVEFEKDGGIDLEFVLSRRFERDRGLLRAAESKAWCHAG